jgi:hypothetical protein
MMKLLAKWWVNKFHEDVSKAMKDPVITGAIYGPYSSFAGDCGGGKITFDSENYGVIGIRTNRLKRNLIQ